MHPLTRARLFFASLLTAALLSGLVSTPALGTTASAEPAHITVASRSLAPNKIERAYSWGYIAAYKHYIGKARPVVARSLFSWFPSLPDWIKEAGWWVKKGVGCGVGVGSFVALGGTTRVAAAVRKISTLAKTDKMVREARIAIHNLGGFKTTLKLLGIYASHRGGGVTAAQAILLNTVVQAGGALVADTLGVTACFQMVSRILD